MRKIFFAALFVLFFACESFAVVSSDTQLILSRLDKMDARLDAMNKRLDDFQVYTAQQYDALNKRIDDSQASINKRFDDLQASTSKEFAAVHKRIDDLRDSNNSDLLTLASRIDDLRHVIYWGIALLGLFLGSPIYGPALKRFFASFEHSGLTIEDVEKYLTLREKKKKESEKFHD